MSTAALDALNQVFCTVTERQAFMFSEPVEAVPIEPETSLTHAAMTFRGPVRGAIEMLVSQQLRVQLAANMLGAEPNDEESERLADDAVKELLNVICGNWLTEVAGSEPVFNLSVPSLETGPAERWQALRHDDHTLRFLVDDEPAWLRIIEEIAP